MTLQDVYAARDAAQVKMAIEALWARQAEAREVNARRLLMVFKAAYKRFYDSGVIPDDLVTAGDLMIKAKHPAVRAFIDVRHDVLGSDRECAAFAVAFAEVDGFNLYWGERDV